MSKKIEFYTICFYYKNKKVDYSVKKFLQDIDSKLFNSSDPVDKVRQIGEKKIRLFSYYYSDNRHLVVLPFGKDKGTNKPYVADENDNLEKIPRDLYDVNSLGYDCDYNVMVFTTNREGPNVNNVQDYLNSFIPDNTGLSLKIEPIFYNTGIEKIRNAQFVKSVSLSLDLGQSLNNFYLNEIETNKTRGLTGALKNIVDTAKNDGDSRTLSLFLGLGHSKKTATLNIESILYLLEQINIGAEFVREINVTYKNGKDEKVDVARLKNSQMMLFHICTSSEYQVSPQVSLDNLDKAVEEKMRVITSHIREFLSDVEQYSGEDIELITKMNKSS